MYLMPIPCSFPCPFSRPFPCPFPRPFPSTPSHYSHVPPTMNQRCNRRVLEAWRIQFTSVSRGSQTQRPPRICRGGLPLRCICVNNIQQLAANGGQPNDSLLLAQDLHLRKLQHWVICAAFFYLGDNGEELRLTWDPLMNEANSKATHAFPPNNEAASRLNSYSVPCSTDYLLAIIKIKKLDKKKQIVKTYGSRKLKRVKYCSGWPPRLVICGLS
jgi:hypothetical protein